MITAYRHSNNKKQNIQANKSLEGDLRGMGYGFFRVEGHWQECQDQNVPYDKCPKEKLVDSTETTFFVPNIQKEQIHSLCKKYEQDAVIYGDKDSDAHLVFTNVFSITILKY